MTDLFILQDSRSMTGTRAMFWQVGGGYTSNIDQAERFSRERAVSQFECRETDLPWPLEYINGFIQRGVDHQYLKLDPVQAISESGVKVFYKAKLRAWDGNCLMWVNERGSLTSNLLEAKVFDQFEVNDDPEGYVFWPKGYIDQHSRPVVKGYLLDHKQALRTAKLKLPKIKRRTWRKVTLNCGGCGRFLSEYQQFQDCPNCGAGNAP